MDGGDDPLGGPLRSVEGWSEQLLAQLVACPSIAGCSSSIADLLQPVLISVGLDVTRIPVDADDLTDHPEYSPPLLVSGGRQPDVLIGRCPGESATELMLFAHTDTEPVHDGWRGDPYSLRIQGRRAVGLGVADDKAGVVAILAAVRAVREAGMAMTKPPRIVLGSGKQGGALGTLPGTLAAVGVSAAVYSHPAESGRGLQHLKVASRGVVEFEITVEGQTPTPVEERTPISADPRQGRNAAARASRLVTALGEHNDGVVRTVTALTAQARPFEVPSVARIRVAHWFGEGDILSITAALTQLLTAAAADDWERSHPPQIVAVGMRANPASCAGDRFAQWAGDVLTQITGAEVDVYEWHSASDIRFPMRCLGVPAVGFGAVAGGFYGADEWVDLPSLHHSVAVLARMMTR